MSAGHRPWKARNGFMYRLRVGFSPQPFSSGFDDASLKWSDWMEKPVWSDRGFSQVSPNAAGSLQPRSDHGERTLCFRKMQRRSLHTRAKEVSGSETHDTSVLLFIWKTWRYSLLPWWQTTGRLRNQLRAPPLRSVLLQVVSDMIGSIMYNSVWHVSQGWYYPHCLLHVIIQCVPVQPTLYFDCFNKYNLKLSEEYI